MPVRCPGPSTVTGKCALLIAIFMRVGVPQSPRGQRERDHLVPLGEGGTDTVENVAALCPNCHRRMHVLNLPTDVAVLRNRVSGR